LLIHGILDAQPKPDWHDVLGLRAFLIFLGNAALTNHELVSEMSLSHKLHID